MSLNNLPSRPLAGLDSMEIYDELRKFFDSIGDVKSWMSDTFGYAAFDVLEFRNKIKQRISSRNLVFLVMVFLGHKLISRRHQAHLRVLKSKLNIQQRANESNQVITLFRIAQSFPEVVAVALNTNPNIDGPLTLAQMRLHSEYPQFPALAVQPLLACLLPRAHTGSSQILNVFFFSNMMLSECLNEKSEIWGSKTKLQRATEILQKQMNHFNSKVFKDDVRKEWCNHLKIMVDNEYSTVWIEAATKSKEKLMEAYGMSCCS